MAYSQKVIDKFEKTLKNPEEASVGRWKPGDKDFHRVGTGIVGAPACGDVMKLQIKCENVDNKNVIVDAKFKTYGCGSAIASSGQLIDMLKGKTIEEAQKNFKSGNSRYFRTTGN
jgi:nitrogen fixation NifU-like protein